MWTRDLSVCGFGMRGAWVLMKLLSLPVLVLILAALPLTAVAMDYGPARPMLAAGGGAPQLPSLESGAPATAPIGKPDVPDSANPGVSAAAPAPLPHASTSANRHADKPAHPGKTATPPSQASWQSLLPGSIQ